MEEIKNTEKKEEVKSQAAKSNERLTPSNNVKSNERLTPSNNVKSNEKLTPSNNVKSNEKLKASTSSKKKKKGSKKPLISLLLILILATSLALAFLYLEPGKGGIFGSYNDIDPDNTHTHDFSECVYTMAPTCYSNGMAEYRCSCGETKTEELISTLVHSVDSKICKGCATDVIYVTKPEDLFYFREDGYYILLNDIDLGGQEWTQKCSDDAPFSGTFDGGGYTIYNFTTNANTGFFYYNNGIIKNLGLRDFSIVGGGSYFGCLVGKNDGIIENCFVEGEINIIPSRYSTDGFGGLVGINYGSIVRSYTDINITCYMQSVYLGGLVGDNHGAISECYATGDITMTYVKDGRIGGLVGYDAGGSISNCYASGDINVAYGEKSFVGGLVGSCHDNSSITNCYASSSITNTISKEYSLDDAYTSIGGFVGYGTATIENCFASGNIYSACKTRSHYVGGFIGEESATLINCYRAEEQQIEMITYTGAGNYYKNDLGIAISEADLKSENWLKENLWKRDNCIWISTNAYPSLNVELREASPVLISTKEDLLALKSGIASSYYRLTADIDLEGMNWEPIGTAEYPFTGVFDGNGYTISNFTCELPGEYLGFFGYNIGEIKNLTLKDFTAKSTPNTYNYYVGALAAKNDGSINNCLVEVDIEASRIAGGITGENRGVIKNCHAMVTITFYKYVDYVGGVAGYNLGSILYTDSAGIITSNSRNYPTGVTEQEYVGGLVSCNNGMIAGCHSSVEIDYKSYEYAYLSVGGLVATNGGKVLGCYATGTVNAENASLITAGGLIGSNIGKVFNCYAVNNVTASTSGKDAVVGRSSCQIGGLVGENGYMIFNCYATGDVHGEGSNAYCYAGGLIGYNADTTEGTRVFFCYASGNVYSEYKGSNGNALAGGFVGHDRGQYASSIIENCYAVGDDNVTIIIKNVPNDTTLNHRTLEISPDEALTVTFFTDLGWMDDVWIITEGEDPTLYIFTTF